MRKLGRLLFKVGAIGLVVLWWSSLNTEPGNAQSGLLEFDDFTCPNGCPIGAEVCCAILDTIYVPRKPS